MEIRRSRRWMRRTGAALAVGAVFGAALWFGFVPHWRPPLRGDEVYGIDVSAHQGAVDWRRVADDQIEFVYVKATEGADFVDERFDANWDAVGAAGLRRGAWRATARRDPSPMPCTRSSPSSFGASRIGGVGA